jgi:hypothetical protein
MWNLLSTSAGSPDQGPRGPRRPHRPFSISCASTCRLRSVPVLAQLLCVPHARRLTQGSGRPSGWPDPQRVGHKALRAHRRDIASCTAQANDVSRFYQWRKPTTLAPEANRPHEQVSRTRVSLPAGCRSTERGDLVTPRRTQRRGWRRQNADVPTRSQALCVARCFPIRGWIPLLGWRQSFVGRGFSGCPCVLRFRFRCRLGLGGGLRRGDKCRLGCGCSLFDRLGGRFGRRRRPKRRLMSSLGGPSLAPSRPGPLFRHWLRLGLRRGCRCGRNHRPIDGDELHRVKRHPSTSATALAGHVVELHDAIRRQLVDSEAHSITLAFALVALAGHEADHSLDLVAGRPGRRVLPGNLHQDLVGPRASRVTLQMADRCLLFARVGPRSGASCIHCSRTAILCRTG